MDLKFKDRLKEKIVLGNLFFDYSVKEKLTLRVGGVAHAWCEPASLEELSAVVKLCSKEKIPFCLVGNGSNILLKDRGFAGVLIRLNQAAFKQIEVFEKRITCGAGVSLLDLLQRLKENQLAGGEFLTGIPGSVGGALRMNAGAHGGCVADILTSVKVMTFDGEVFEKKREELVLEYRHAPFFKNHIALSATFSFQLGKKAVIQNRIKELNQKRAAVTPPHFSAGCIFKNPKGASAGGLIDQAGLKGSRQGEAQVSLEHGNYFVNLGNASAKDLLALIETVQKKVEQVHGVCLEPEIRIIGE